MKKRTFFVVLILFLVFLNSLIMVLSLVMLKDQVQIAEVPCVRYLISWIAKTFDYINRVT